MKVSINAFFFLSFSKPYKISDSKGNYWIYLGLYTPLWLYTNKEVNTECALHNSIFLIKFLFLLLVWAPILATIGFNTKYLNKNYFYESKRQN
jgi:hypothetical protein